MADDPYRFDHLTTLGSLAEAIGAESLRSATNHGTCRWCKQPIHFAPYFLDGKLPNPPKWIHSPPRAGTTCITRPDDWPQDSWPLAEPDVEVDA